MSWTGMEEAPKSFGQYPGMRKLYARRIHTRPFLHSYTEALEHYLGKPVSLATFRDARHPLVTLIPRNQIIELYYDDHHVEPVGFERFQTFFSSYDLYIERDYGLFEDAFHPAMLRTGSMGQLGYLVQPFHFPTTEAGQLMYIVPIYPHARLLHLCEAAAMGYLILCRNDFDQKITDQFTRAVLTHDIALPAGGDSVKRIDPQALDEESNYSEVMIASGLAKLWKDSYGFDLPLAASWVRNEGTMGRLLDVVDKMSYVMLDCYYFGKTFNGKVRRHCLRYPLFMDVWQDVRFTSDKSAFAFIDPDRLYQFIMARALEHQELLLNPKSRTVDFDLTNLVAPLYASGKITRKDLLTWSTTELEMVLNHTYPPERITRGLVTPDDYAWAKFSCGADMQQYVKMLPPDTLINTEHIRGFDTCLHWPVFTNARRTKIAPLRALISNKKVQRLESIRDACVGYFAYSYTKRPR